MDTWHKLSQSESFPKILFLTETQKKGIYSSQTVGATLQDPGTIKDRDPHPCAANQATVRDNSRAKSPGSIDSLAPKGLEDPTQPEPFTV